MRLVRLKEWVKKDTSLVVNNHFTSKGLSVYWRSVDKAVQFNIQKREEYIVHENFKALNFKRKPEMPISALVSHDNRDNMYKVFEKRRKFDRSNLDKNAPTQGGENTP